jgi:3-oxoadipate enol-lactonase
MWGPQVEALRAAGHDPVAPDLPGFGDEPLAPPTVDYVGFAAEQLGETGAVVGCSYGGKIALELAGARPELVDRLVLVAPGIAEWSEETRAGFAEEEALVERGDLGGAARQQAAMWLAPGAVDEVRDLTVLMTLRSYEQQLPVDGRVEAIWPDPPAAERLGELRIPTLLVVGGEDRPELRELCERLARELPDARLETIAGAGHLPSIERPDELNALLLGFLDDRVR